MKNRKDAFIRGLILLLFIFTCVYVSISLYKIISSSAPDFLGFSQATSYLLHHKNPYNIHGVRIIIIPPISALTFVPFLSLPYRIAQGLFVLLSVLAVPLIVIVSLKIVYKKIPYYLVFLFTSLAFLSFPVKFTLGMGQTNLLALLFLLFGYYLFEKKRVVVSGVLIAIAFLVKPILLFVILFFLFRKAWKTILTIIGTGIFLTIVAGLLFGVPVDLYYVFHVVPLLLGNTADREVYYNQGLMGFVSRAISDLSLRKYITELISLVVLAYTFIRILSTKYGDNFIFSLFLTLLLIIHTLAWQHQFVMLIFPFVFLTKIIFEKKSSILIFLLILSYALVSWNFKDPGQFSHFPSSLLLSTQFYGAVLSLVLLYYTKNRVIEKKVS